MLSWNGNPKCLFLRGVTCGAGPVDLARLRAKMTSNTRLSRQYFSIDIRHIDESHF
jgi:hypothetical protein